MLKIIKNKCKNCNLCIEQCFSNAIDLNKYQIDNDVCAKCFHCLAICPQSAITFNNKTTNKFNIKRFDEKGFEEIVQKRRSHRHFLDKQVPKETINKIVDLIRYSPTGTNTQKVFITIITNKKKLKIFSGLITNFYLKITRLLFNYFFYPFLLLFIGKKITKRFFKLKKYFYENYKKKDIITFNAPCIFIFHAPPKTSSTPDQDCSIWSATGVLYSEYLGLSTCFNGFIVLGLNLSKKIKQFLKIPKNHKIYSSFLLGYPKYKFIRKVIREDAKVNII